MISTIASKRWLASSLSVSLLFSASPAFSQLANTAWPKFQKDLQNTGRADFNGPQTTPVTKVESDRFKGKRRSSPSILPDGTLVFGNANKPLTAADPNTLVKLWDSAVIPKAGKNDRSQVVVSAAGDAYIGARDNRQWGFANGGAIVFNFKVPADGDTTPSATIDSNNIMYFGSDALGNGFMYGWDLTPVTGGMVWMTAIGRGVKNVAPALSHDESELYVTGAGQFLFAMATVAGGGFNPGDVKWRVKLQQNSAGSRHNNYSPMVGDDGTVYVPFRSGVFAVDPTIPTVDPVDASEKIVWSHIIPEGAIASGLALSTDGSTIFGSSSKRTTRVWALDSATGNLNWVEELVARGKSRNNQPVVGADGKVYLGVGRLMYCFNPAGDGGGGGDIIWSTLESGRFQSSAIIPEEGVLIYGLSNKRLYRVED